MGVALAVLASLVYVLWPSEPGSRGEASTSHVPPAQRGVMAARALRSLPAANMSIAYAPVEDGSVTHADLMVTAQGQASGTLSQPVAGKSTMAWSGDQLYLKGDSEFWAQQGPSYGRDLTSTGHWVAPEKRSGYYMLNNFAVNAGSLTPKSLASVVTRVTSDPEAVEQNAGTIEGHKATSYTAQGWTVVLADNSPYTVLAIGGDPSHQSPVKPAAWHSPQRTMGRAEQSDSHTTVTPADYADSRYSAYLLMVPKPATAEQAAAVRSAATSAAATAVAPATSSEVVSKSMGPDFTITNDSEYLCTSNPCEYSFTVTNIGDAAGAATLYLSLPRVPDQPHPLGTLKPKQSKNVSGSRPNIAWGTGRTVKHTDYAWVYSSAEYGSDPKVGSRLHARNLRPDDLSVATPLKPTVAKLLDLMTKDKPTSDTAASDKAVDALEEALSQGVMPALGAIAESRRLKNPEDLREILPTTDKVENRRVLQQIAQLLRADPKAKVTWAGPYKTDGKTYQADYFYTTTRQGQETKRAVRAKTVRIPGQLGPQMSLGAEQLNGEQEGSTNAGNKKAPPGFERMLQINLEPGVGPVLALATTTGLEQLLSTGQQFRQARESLCQPNGGGPRVDRLVIVNESGTHQWTDLRRVGARCTGSGGAPASPSTSSSDKPDKPTCLTQRPPDGVVESNGAGWIYYAPTGSHKRATAVTACLKSPVGDGTASDSNSPGMKEARQRAKALYPNADDDEVLVNSCHLVAKSLGGHGYQRNLTPCWATPVNVGAMTRIESTVRIFLAKKKGIVRMTALAKYKDDDAVIPYAFTFSFTAWDSRGNPYPLAVPGGGTVQNVKDGHYLNP
ncbi:DNA/RNA non-specific endonuclease [Streptomyces sp. NBC_00378]|uniref:DNA/RNA non-specific endonuclease n=1 Tax=unclassified Streptomyces TaxID=2593676 RepID=UPI002259BF4A|nr:MULTISPECIES: DNA/RNA non-specific endonuclease [unclassified Streptomyces]MCX5115268.1 DNA/RNA non-specific endonuclease [Streptomyces sp. NBC_00378]